ncbi:MAG: type II toxin-antitoxin system RelE/ParE family toxin [Acidobacteriota bacterium]|nr:type II toxin-antitoxin system RelE/ParE family toxin [Acidobacteriota bacterium]
MSDYRIFETDQFQDDLGRITSHRKQKIAVKLRTHVYPQFRLQPYYGKNIRKLKDYTPETWRYRIGDYRFFYEIDDKRKIVFMIAADLRSRSY